MEQGAQVLKKSITMGIMEGTVVRVIGDRVRVKWLSTGFRSTLKASAVLPYTPENLKLLEDRWDRRRALFAAQSVPDLDPQEAQA